MEGPFSQYIRQLFKRSLESNVEKQMRSLFPNEPLGSTRSLRTNIDLYNNTSPENRHLLSLLSDIAHTARSILVDVDRNGRSASACFSYSWILRDAFNYFFKETNEAQEALLTAGYFGSADRNDHNHHWVTILKSDAPDLPSAPTAPRFDEGVIVDGTIDQFGYSTDLPVHTQIQVRATQVFFGTKEMDLTKLYYPKMISPIPPTYYIPAEIKNK